MNPMNMLRMAMSGGRNPQEVVKQLIGNGNPMLNNLDKMAEEGDYQGVENFARNLCKEQGRDFDSELKQLQNLIGNFK